MNTACARCGKDPADGEAYIGEDRFCHEDDPSCYELAQWDDALSVRDFALWLVGQCGLEVVE